MTSLHGCALLRLTCKGQHILLPSVLSELFLVRLQRQGTFSSLQVAEQLLTRLGCHAFPCPILLVEGSKLLESICTTT